MPATLGLRFSETMAGGFTLGAVDPAVGELTGIRNATKLVMRCEVSVDDLEQFVLDPQHSGNLSGTIDFGPLGTAIQCEQGVFNLFCPGNAAGEKWMVYELPFANHGQEYYLAGKKLVRHSHEAEVLQETTTLFVLLHRGHDSSGEIAGAGILHLGARNIADMVRTIDVINAQNSFDTMRGLAMYLKLFLGELWHTYV